MWILQVAQIFLCYPYFKLKDKVKIGSNTVLVAPVTIEEGANVGALSVITKNVPQWALAITRAPMKILADWVKNHI